MLNHLFRTVVLAFCLSLASTVAMAEDIKVGVLDWQQLLTKSPQAEAAGKRLEKKFEGPKDKLVNKQKEYNNKREQWQRDKDTMAMAQRNQREKEIAKMEQDLHRMDEELRSDYATAHREEMDAFIQLVKGLLDKFAQEEKFDLILPQEATLFVAERIDITSKILALLEKNKKP